MSLATLSLVVPLVSGSILVALLLLSFGSLAAVLWLSCGSLAALLRAETVRKLGFCLDTVRKIRWPCGKDALVVNRVKMRLLWLSLR